MTDRDCEKRKQLLELTKYVKILEYRLQQAQRIDALKVESEESARLEEELNRIKKRAESDQKENRELYLQIISLRTSERALKDENRRLNNRLDQLSLHGTQVQGWNRQKFNNEKYLKPENRDKCKKPEKAEKFQNRPVKRPK